MILLTRYSVNSVWENKDIYNKRNNLMKNVEESYDVVVVGAGHAGCEAALHVHVLDLKQYALR